MKKLVLNLAMSLDGYISDENGGFDWIVGQGDSRIDTVNDFDFNEFMQTIDTVVMGSKSYEDCILSGLNNFENQKVYVATTRELKGKDNVEFFNGDIVENIEILKKEKGKDIFLFGGASVAEPLIKADVIDQYIIGIIPTLLGSGLMLFKGGHPSIDLHLDELSISDGIIIAIYSKRKI